MLIDANKAHGIVSLSLRSSQFHIQTFGYFCSVVHERYATLLQDHMSRMGTRKEHRLHRESLKMCGKQGECEMFDITNHTGHLNQLLHTNQKNFSVGNHQNLPLEQQLGKLFVKENAPCTALTGVSNPSFRFCSLVPAHKGRLCLFLSLSALRRMTDFCYCGEQLLFCVLAALLPSGWCDVVNVCPGVCIGPQCWPMGSQNPMVLVLSLDSFSLSFDLVPIPLRLVLVLDSTVEDSSVGRKTSSVAVFP